MDTDYEAMMKEVDRVRVENAECFLLLWPEIMWLMKQGETGLWFLATSGSPEAVENHRKAKELIERCHYSWLKACREKEAANA